VPVSISQEEEEVIVQAIAEAELKTSGEIRVHVETNCNEEPFKRAIEVFHLLEMHKTELRNGVLIYVALKDKKLAIIGDAGIDKVVPENFWNETKENLILSFKTGTFAKGISEAVYAAGTHLQKYFPRLDNDTNELSNELSRGE
jgi:uncharacterized membrane protein